LLRPQPIQIAPGFGRKVRKSPQRVLAFVNWLNHEKKRLARRSLLQNKLITISVTLNLPDKAFTWALFMFSLNLSRSCPASPSDAGFQ
jgi:hypothetical protein